MKRCPSSSKCKPVHEALTPRPRRNAPRVDPGSIGPVELEAIHAIGAWKERTGQAFPTVTELLGILRGIGWRPPEGK
jgi:hypothetical protein